MIRDFVNHGTHDPEEYPFLEELHALRRLLATLFAMRNWEDIHVYLGFLWYLKFDFHWEPVKYNIMS